jgi:hypothetical protein
VLPLDEFAVRQGRLEFSDLEANYFGSEQSYSVQWFTFDNITGERSAIAGATSLAVPERPDSYLAAEIRGERPEQIVTVYLRDGKQIVGREAGLASVMTVSRR